MKVIVEGRFSGMNEVIAANRVMRGGWSKGNAIKHEEQEIVCAYIRAAKIRKLNPPVYLKYTFYEKNKKRDKDNISGWFHKIFQDSLVLCGKLHDDGWDYIKGFSDDFEIDKKNPRVEVEIIEA